jgi:extracellular elastinolytic metalloproteinase
MSSPWPVNSPTAGSRIIVKDPADSQTSDFDWHSDGNATYKTTRGNNAIVQSNWDGEEDEAKFIDLPRPTSESLTFEYPYDPEEKDWKSYVNASITRAF